jgi:hypothetical protein
MSDLFVLFRQKGNFVPEKRTICQNWVVEHERDSNSGKNHKAQGDDGADENRIDRAVRKALSQLTPLEREFIERYYFSGETPSEIARALDRKLCRLAGIRRRGIAKLKKYLAPFVRREFGLKMARTRNCPICRSPFRAEIDGLIKAKGNSETWKPMMKVIRSRYKVKIGTPQVLISHQKYHIEED